MTWVIEQLQAFQWGFAGFIGALVASWLRRDELKSRRELFWFVFSGAAMAHFLTGLASTYLEISPANAGGIGFLLGLLGGTGAQVIIKLILDKKFLRFFDDKWGDK